MYLISELSGSRRPIWWSISCKVFYVALVRIVRVNSFSVACDILHVTWWKTEKKNKVTQIEICPRDALVFKLCK